jgi:hypothetical protein
VPRPTRVSVSAAPSCNAATPAAEVVGDLKATEGGDILVLSSARLFDDRVR